MSLFFLSDSNHSGLKHLVSLLSPLDTLHALLVHLLLHLLVPHALFLGRPPSPDLVDSLLVPG